MTEELITVEIPRHVAMTAKASLQRDRDRLRKQFMNAGVRASVRAMTGMEVDYISQAIDAIEKVTR